MTEREWVTKVLQPALQEELPRTLTVDAERKLPYVREIRDYERPGAIGTLSPVTDTDNTRVFATDLLVGEPKGAAVWRPRVVVEVKTRVTTHDAITYSQKAFLHKTVSPHLRYGFLFVTRSGAKLPGRLLRHGVHFDFMLSFKTTAGPSEIQGFAQLIVQEVEASRRLQELLYRKRGPSQVSLLHRALRLT